MTETTILDDRAVSEIEDRANAATRGPWHTAKRRPALVIAEDRARVADCHVGIGMAVDEAQFNSEFIAHAREDIPALCATVKHLRAENNEYERRWRNQTQRNHTLSQSNRDLQSQLEQLRAENERLKSERDRWKRKYNRIDIND